MHDGLFKRFIPGDAAQDILGLIFRRIDRGCPL